MFSRRLKTGYFVLEGLNSFSTVYYFYYFYFFMQKAFGFGNKANLLVAALNGATYALCAWWGGRFAQRFGYFRALKIGLLIMAGSLLTGAFLTSAWSQVVGMVVTVVGMSFIWPTLEALVSEGEPREGLQQMVGIYNVVWAGTAAIANFTGGAMLDKFGLKSLFFVPAAIQLTQLVITLWLEKLAKAQTPAVVARSAAQDSDYCMNSRRKSDPSHGALQPRVEAPIPRGAKSFLRMAWLANPFAYIAINTLIAVVPGVASRLQLTTTIAGFCCSTWCFSRLGAFALLWQWSGWHYRFRWLLLGYIALVGAFLAVLLAPNVAVLVVAQLVFGAAVGLIYYSSLFYSMDASDTKGEHGGIHEAAIGLGNFAGPAVGAATLQFLPQFTNGGTLAVTLLLLCGLGALTAVWRSSR